MRHHVNLNQQRLNGSCRASTSGCSRSSTITAIATARWSLLQLFIATPVRPLAGRRLPLLLLVSASVAAAAAVQPATRQDASAVCCCGAAAIS
jgi:hypothetical protein